MSNHATLCDQIDLFIGCQHGGGVKERKKVRNKINNALTCLGTLPLKWYMKNTKCQRMETYNNGVATELQLDMKIKHISWKKYVFFIYVRNHTVL